MIIPTEIIKHVKRTKHIGLGEYKNPDCIDKRS